MVSQVRWYSCPPRLYHFVLSDSPESGLDIREDLGDLRGKRGSTAGRLREFIDNEEQPLRRKPQHKIDSGGYGGRKVGLWTIFQQREDDEEA